MADLTVPVLRFRSGADRERAVGALTDQQFTFQQESDTEISFTPWQDRDEARDLLEADGIACERGDKPVARRGPRIPVSPPAARRP